MPIGANLKSVLDKLPAEKRALVEKAFTDVDEITTELEQGYLRQADYTRKTQEVAELERTLRANWDDANTEYQRMLAEHQQLEDSLSATQAEKDAAAAKLAEAERKLSAAPPAIDPTKIVTPESMQAALQTELKKLAAGQTAYFGRTLRTVSQHRKLFGDDLDPEELIQKAMAAGKTPDAYWEEQYKVADKRQEIATAAAKKHDEEVESRGYQKRLAEEANPATRPLRSSENPFYSPAPADGKAPSPWDTNTQTEADTKFLEELQKLRA